MRGHGFQTAACLCLVLGCLHWCSQVSRENRREDEDTPVTKWLFLSQKFQIVKDMRSKMRSFFPKVAAGCGSKSHPVYKPPLQTRIYIQCSENSPKSTSKGNLMVTWNTLKVCVKCQPDSKHFCFYAQVIIECNQPFISRENVKCRLHRYNHLPPDTV